MRKHQMLIFTTLKSAIHGIGMSLFLKAKAPDFQDRFAPPKLCGGEACS
jgi:hypothetical protein